MNIFLAAKKRRTMKSSNCEKHLQGDDKKTRRREKQKLISNEGESYRTSERQKMISQDLD